MMYRLWRYDVFRFAQNDVAPLRVAMMRCLPLCARRHTSLGEAVIIGFANIICRRQTSFPKTKALLTKCFCFWRRHPDLNRGIKVLQTEVAFMQVSPLIPIKSRDLTIFIIIKNSSGRELDGNCF